MDHGPTNQRSDNLTLGGVHPLHTQAGLKVVMASARGDERANEAAGDCLNTTAHRKSERLHQTPSAVGSLVRARAGLGHESEDWNRRVGLWSDMPGRGGACATTSGDRDCSRARPATGSVLKPPSAHCPPLLDAPANTAIGFQTALVSCKATG